MNFSLISDDESNEQLVGLQKKSSSERVLAPLLPVAPDFLTSTLINEATPIITAVNQIMSPSTGNTNLLLNTEKCKACLKHHNSIL